MNRSWSGGWLLAIGSNLVKVVGSTGGAVTRRVYLTSADRCPGLDRLSIDQLMACRDVSVG